jgi:CO/xanthine dehydrogenase FAD-binding subunit
MRWFDYAAPETVPEALALLATRPRALVLAGGTDLLVQLRAGRREADLVVDIKRIPELNTLKYDPAEGLTLGAAVPCSDVHEHRDVRQHYPSLAETAGIIGGTLIQNRASFGGNLCNSSPSADTVPLLIALRASCRIASPSGERRVPVEEFCSAPGRNVLGPGEMLIALTIPPPESDSGACYLRFTPRKEMDIAVAGAGVAVALDNGSFRWARIALAAVAPVPLLVPDAGSALAGQPVADDGIARAAALAAAAAKPIDDMRASAQYRRHLVGVLTRRALHTAVRRAQGGTE